MASGGAVPVDIDSIGYGEYTIYAVEKEWQQIEEESICGDSLPRPQGSFMSCP